MKIVCMSDSHGLHRKMPLVPDGDVLVVAGDFTNVGAEQEIKDFNEWLGQRPHKHKIVIAGNHDWYFQWNGNKKNIINNATYLQDESTIIDGVKFYGSPHQPEFCNWAFNLPRGKELKEKWDLIPEDTDVLITHGPPKGILDWAFYSKEHVGCLDLLDRVYEINPKVHIFGHIHIGYGTEIKGNTTFVNAAICSENYQPTNSPIVVEI